MSAQRGAPLSRGKAHLRPPSSIVGRVLVGVGIFTLGLAAGRLLMPIDHEASGPIVLNGPAATTNAEVASTVPDVGGLSLTDARAVWADAGLPVGTIEISRRPYAGVENIVVSQVPVPGSAYAEGDRLFLAVARQGVMPALIGATLADAQATMTDLGSSLDVRERFAPRAQPGTILSTSPAAGAPLDVMVSVTVASAGDAVYLASLPDQSGDCWSEDSWTVGATELGPSLLCDPYEGESARSRFVLAGFNGFVDGSLMMESDGSATVTISVDGALLGTFDVPGDGSLVPVHLGMAAVSVLQIQVSTTGGGTVALGEMRVTGAPKAIAHLAEQS